MNRAWIAADDTPPPPRPATAPRGRTKAAFWLLLGMLSTAFAEVTCGSARFPFFLPWGILVVTPLYTLHLVCLASILARTRRLTWPGLCFAGALFGMYEAYMTKVLWAPDWGLELAVPFAGVMWLHVVLLVLWWHPLMAFIVPLWVGEACLTGSRHVLNALPGVRRATWGGRRGVVGVMVLATACGLMAGAGVGGVSQGAILVSVLSNGVLLAVLMAWFRRSTGSRYTLTQLLPGPRALKRLFLLLGVYYVFTGFVLLPERLPRIEGHVAVWLVYAVLAALLMRSARTKATDNADNVGNAVVVPMRRVWIFVAVSTLAAVACMLLLGPAAGMLYLLNWLLACVVGLPVYAHAVWTARRPCP